MNIKNVLKIFQQMGHREVLYIIYISILKLFPAKWGFQKIEIFVVSLYTLVILGETVLSVLIISFNFSVKLLAAEDSCS